jgi:hypothetical protein
MARTVRSMVLGSLVVAMLACGAPVPSDPPVSGPESSPTSTAQPEEHVPISITEVLADGIDSGRWTEPEGILTALGYLAGELTEEEVFGAETPTSVEGTGVIRRAQAYLADASNADGREDMARLLSILIPMRRALEDLSEPAAAADASAPGLALPARRPASQAEVPCWRLWSTGYSEPIICFRYHERAIGGRTHRVYAPRDWPSEIRLALVDEALAALDDSLGLYNGYGPAPVMSTDIVFTELPFLDGAVRRPSVMAVASDDVSDGRCHVGVFPAAGTSGLASLKQTIAHELFHCYQYTNYPGKVFPLPEEVNGWWVEGTAEFFGSIVYPTGNDEWRFAPAFNETSTYSPMHQMSYEAYLLFQYLAVQQGWGTEGVLGIIQRMPESGTDRDQRDALAAVDGIADAFHQFGRAYLDQKLRDPGGGFVPVDPQPGESSTFHQGANHQDYPSEGFWLDRYRLHFDDRTRFETTTEEGDGEGRLSARLVRAPGSWGEIPTAINTACEDGEFLILVTSAVPTAGTPRTFDVRADGEEVREDLECDECLVGTWTLDNASYLAHMGGLWAAVQGLMPTYGLDTEGAQAVPTGVFGLMQIKFCGWHGQRLPGRMGHRRHGHPPRRDDDSCQHDVRRRGRLWRIEEDPATDVRYVLFDGGEFSMTGQMIFEGQPLRPIPFGGSNDPAFLSSPQPFQCTEATLSYHLNDEFGPIVFIRTPDSEPSP